MSVGKLQSRGRRIRRFPVVSNHRHFRGRGTWDVCLRVYIDFVSVEGCRVKRSSGFVRSGFVVRVLIPKVLYRRRGPGRWQSVNLSFRSKSGTGVLRFTRFYPGTGRVTVEVINHDQISMIGIVENITINFRFNSKSKRFMEDSWKSSYKRDGQERCGLYWLNPPFVGFLPKENLGRECKRRERVGLKSFLGFVLRTLWVSSLT